MQSTQARSRPILPSVIDPRSLKSCCWRVDPAAMHCATNAMLPLRAARCVSLCLPQRQARALPSTMVRCSSGDASSSSGNNEEVQQSDTVFKGFRKPQEQTPADALQNTLSGGWVRRWRAAAAAAAAARCRQPCSPAAPLLTHLLAPACRRLVEKRGARASRQQRHPRHNQR